MDDVFKAINDPSRRLLLDSLFAADGQTLGELCGHLPAMTRYGVMSHLRVLEDAGLLSTQKQGRKKLHYLNPVPIKLVHDRWITKYAARRVGAITDIDMLIVLSPTCTEDVIAQVTVLRELDRHFVIKVQLVRVVSL